MSIRRPRLTVQPLEDRAVPAGLLDPTFSGDGYLMQSLNIPGIASVTGEDVLVQPDGKVVAVGRTAGNTHAVILRYNPDGTLDPTFNTTGFNYIDIPISTSQFFGVAPQGTKLIAVGTTWSSPDGDQLLIARFNADGTLDTTFDGDGLVRTNVSGLPEGINSVAIQPDNKIVVAGNVQVQIGLSHTRALVLRYRPEGQPDLTFGGTGQVQIDLGQTTASATSVLAAPDGKIVVAGYSNSSDTSNQSFAVARLTSVGALDGTFDGDGIVKTRPTDPNFHAASDAALTPDGKIVLAGKSQIGTDFRPAVAALRYNSDGSLDPTFGGTGYVVTDLGPTAHTEALGVAVQADGRIVAAGYVAPPGLSGNNKSMVLRYNVDGSLDTTFGQGGSTLVPGVVITDIQTSDLERFQGVALQPDGGIVAVGMTVGLEHTLTVARYTNDTLTAVDDAYTTGRDTPLSVPRLGYKSNDVMPGQPEPVGELVTGPAHAAAFNFGANGSFTYTPAAGYVGEDTITYRLNSSAGTSNTATITINVTEPNAAPTAVADVYTLPETGPLVVPAPGILANDTDPDGDPLTATVVDPPAVGTLTLDSTGGFTYDFPADLVGPVSFTYKVSDGTAESAPATVTLTRGPAVTVTGSVLTVRGTAGADVARLRPSGTAIRVELVTPEGVIRRTVRAIGAPRFTRVDVFLGDGDDRLDAAGLTVPIRADGGAGNDALRTGGGRDTVLSGPGNDALITGSGNDLVTAGDGANEIQTGAGDDTVTTGAGGSLIDAGAGNDQVTAAGGANYIEGGSGNDVLVAGGGVDLIDGGLGNDLIAGGAGADLIEGADGNDILIDGTVALVNPATDSLTKVLADYRPNNRPALIDISTRIAVTFDVTATDTLTGGRGIDWFWSDDLLDVLDLTGTEPRNAQT